MVAIISSEVARFYRILHDKLGRRFPGNSLTSTRTTDFRRFGPFSNKIWYYDDWIKEGTGKKEVRDREREDIGTLKCRVSVSKAVCGDGVWACVGIKVPLDLHIKRLDPTNHSRIILLFALCIH